MKSPSNRLILVRGVSMQNIFMCRKLKSVIIAKLSTFQNENESSIEVATTTVSGT